ncbi:MAG: O-antigen/teichoic acid export membrane protein [Halieaceae bacterium]
MKSLSSSALASLLAQLSGALGLILSTPVFIAYLGPEAYGLLGVLTTVQALIVLMDLGVSTALMRETARNQSSGQSVGSYGSFFRLVILFALAGAALIALIAVAGADYIAVNWLNAEQLPLVIVGQCLLAILLGLAFRWLSSFPRAVGLGIGWVGRVSCIVILMNALRYGLACLLLMGEALSLSSFFWFQAGVAALETLALTGLVWRRTPRPLFGRINLGGLLPELRTSAALSAAVLMWIASSQLDRVLLSGLLPLREFGHFMLGVTLASGVTILLGPLGSVLIPVLTALNTKGNHSQLRIVYFDALALAAVAASAIGVTLMFFADEVILLWLGNARPSGDIVASVTFWYTLGNTALVIGSLPYYLQVARAGLRYHLWGTAFSSVILIPAVILLVISMGALGAAYAWAAVNVLMLGWSLYVTERLMGNLSVRAWGLAVGVPVLTVVAVAYTVDHFLVIPGERLMALLTLMGVGCVIGVAGLAASWLAHRLNARLIESTADRNGVQSG